MLGAALTLRFDGSFRGGCGGAGAVLLSGLFYRSVLELEPARSKLKATGR